MKTLKQSHAVSSLKAPNFNEAPAWYGIWRPAGEHWRTVMNQAGYPIIYLARGAAERAAAVALAAELNHVGLEVDRLKRSW